MRITPEHARILESRLRRRLNRAGARRIALLGAGRFAHELLNHAHQGKSFAGAQIVAVIDEASNSDRLSLNGLRVVHTPEKTPCDAIVVATPMHEPAILRRAAGGAFGAIPVIGLHTIDTLEELDVDALLTPETAWFGMDLPGLLKQAGKTLTIASPSGLPRVHTIETSSFWEANTATPVEQLRWDGVNLYEFVRGSMACQLGRIDIDPVSDLQALVGLMEETIQIYESAMGCFRQSSSPGIVVVANGLFHHQRAVAHAAMRCGKRAITIESSCFPDLCRLALCSTNARPGRHERSNHIEKPFTKPQRDRALAYLRDRQPHVEERNDTDSQPAPMEPAAIREQLKIPEGNRVLLLLGQVCTDTSLVYEAPVIHDIPELARIAARVIAGNDRWTLIIKPHPKEATGTDPVVGKPYHNGDYDRLLADPISAQDNVHLVGPSEHNVYSLMRLADTGLSINSQSALEMISMFARPVCLAGHSPYSGIGFTRDVGSRSALAPAICELLERPVLTKQEHDLALRFVDRAVFETLIPIDISSTSQAVTRDNEAIRALLGVSGDHLLGRRERLPVAIE